MEGGGDARVHGVLSKFPYNKVEIMGGKFSHKLEVLLPWKLLNRNFLKENWQYSHAGWEKNFGTKIFSKLLLGQCIINGGSNYMLFIYSCTAAGFSVAAGLLYVLY